MTSRMASRMASGMTSMASVIRLLRLRIIVIVGVGRPHVMAHIVAAGTAGTLGSGARIFLAPRTLDRGPADIGAVDRHDGRAGGLFIVVPDEGVAFVPEVPDFEDPAVRAKGRAYGIFIGV